MTTVELDTNNLRQMDFHRKNSPAARVLYLLTFVSIPFLFLHEHVKTDPAYTGPGLGNLVFAGRLLEGIAALACIASGVVLKGFNFEAVARLTETGAGTRVWTVR